MRTSPRVLLIKIVNRVVFDSQNHRRRGRMPAHSGTGCSHGWFPLPRLSLLLGRRLPVGCHGPPGLQPGQGRPHCPVASVVHEKDAVIKRLNQELEDAANMTEEMMGEIDELTLG